MQSHEKAIPNTRFLSPIAWHHLAVLNLKLFGYNLEPPTVLGMLPHHLQSELCIKPTLSLFLLKAKLFSTYPIYAWKLELFN